MGKIFSDAVEEALDYIFYNARAGKGKEGLEILKKASEEGDGDASCILARCYGGPQYIWYVHDFPEDDELFDKYIHKSVEQGSALGVLVSIRCGEYSEEMAKKMPFANLKEVFNVVLEKAEAGDPFCQYTIGNTYFWWDFMDIEERTPESFPNREAFRAYLRENIMKCEEWFLKALRGGIHFAANNLRRLYTEGEEGIIEPRPELAKDLYKIGAESGHPDLQWGYGDDLKNAGKLKESIDMYKLAAEGGQLECWYNVAHAYREGKVVPQDMKYAAECYEKCVVQKKISFSKKKSAAILGYMYCDGVSVPKDTEKAFYYLKMAEDCGETSRIAWLGKCYFYGWGTYKDDIKARECIEKADTYDEECNYIMGVIYANGLGVKEDIGKGVKYLKNAPSLKEAKEELAKYKKPLLGKWTRK